MRMDSRNMADQQLVCLSPNGCCVAVGLQENIYFFDSGHLLTNSEYRNESQRLKSRLCCKTTDHFIRVTCQNLTVLIEVLNSSEK